MAIRFTDRYSAGWQGVVLHFAEGDELPGSELANYLLTTGAPVEETDPPPPPETPDDGDVPDEGDGIDPDGTETVPDGTVAEVLTWVGDDRDRAQRALDAERAGKDRAGVTGPLTKLLES